MKDRSFLLNTMLHQSQSFLSGAIGGPCAGFLLSILAAVLPARGEMGKPGLVFEKAIGDLRGKGIDNHAVAVADDGSICLLVTRERVAVFDRSGHYRKTLCLASPANGKRPYLNVSGKWVLVGDLTLDYPWVYATERQGTEPGSFLNPGRVTAGADGHIYVADGGNKRIQIFAPDDHTNPNQVVSVPEGKNPVAVSVRDSRMAVLTEQGDLFVYALGNGAPALLASLLIGSDAVSAALGPGDCTVVMYNGNPVHHGLITYQLTSGKLKEVSRFAPSHLQDWPCLFPAPVTLITGPRGRIWFATREVHGAVLKLDPRTDQLTPILENLSRPTAVNFDHDGQMMVAMDGPGRKGPVIRTYGNPDHEPVALLHTAPADGVLYDEPTVPLWSFLPDGNDGMICRLIEKGWQKGWPAFTLKHIFGNGDIESVIDFGALYAKRTRFSPWEAKYAVEFTADGNLVLASKPMVSVMKLSPQGKIRWEATDTPAGNADHVEFGCPADIALDRAGRIWVVDQEKNAVFCLSPEGKLLLTYGQFASWDDMDGAGFSQPSGLAIAEVDGKEFLYVGDAGNGRLLKYQIHER